MQIKEETLCSFNQKGVRLQLIKLTKTKIAESIYGKNEKMVISNYQVRLKRRVVHSSISEYNERKVFATYCQNIVLQLKIY